MGQPEKTAEYGVSIFALWCQFGVVIFIRNHKKNNRRHCFSWKKHTHVTVKCWKMEIMEMWHQKKKRTTGVALALNINRPICAYCLRGLEFKPWSGTTFTTYNSKHNFLIITVSLFFHSTDVNIMHCVLQCFPFCVFPAPFMAWLCYMVLLNL